MANILIIDDERSIRNTLKDILEFEGHQVSTVEDGSRGLQKAYELQPDLIFSDIKMPGIDGIELLQLLKHPTEEDKMPISCPIVMISGHGNIETAVTALKMGAYDYLEKPIDINRLIITTKNALEHHSLNEEINQKQKEIGALKTQIGDKNQMVGDSEAIENVRKIVMKVAPTDARVLITGENGTGKEVVARLIHQNSQRANQPIIEVNCAAIPSELIESELFGHTKGSFTGAVKDRAGKFEQANGGTLFLDEIGDMSLPAQTKVLRALQENEITRVGSDKAVKVNVRVLAATNKNLHTEIEKGTFREDLFHRLNVIPIHIPSLDERKEDIPLLIDHFLSIICKEEGWAKKSISDNAILLLQQRTWPGNVRELRNVVERLIILSGKEITEQDVHDFA